MPKVRDKPRPTPGDYKTIFEDNRIGALILEELCDRFVQPALLTGGIDAILTTFSREGQRKPLDWILTRINQANEPTDQPANPEVLIQ